MKSRRSGKRPNGEHLVLETFKSLASGSMSKKRGHAEDAVAWRNDGPWKPNGRSASSGGPGKVTVSPDIQGARVRLLNANLPKLGIEQERLSHREQWAKPYKQMAERSPETNHITAHFVGILDVGC